MPENAVHTLYAQLVGIGVLWVSVHCSGMCGPIMAGLTLSNRPKDANIPKRRQALRDAAGVLTYQAGRALTYLVLGAIAGLVGAAAESWIQGVARTTGLVVAVALFLVGFTQLPDFQGLLQDLRRAKARRNADENAPRPTPPLSARFVQKLFQMLPTHQRFGTYGRMLTSGMILGFLPCSLMFWVLSLSAASASPFHGGMLMLTLILLTTPVLVISAVSAGFLTGKWRRIGAYAIPIGMMFSGFWLGLIACAANDWIPHASIPLTLVGKEFHVVLW